MEGHLRISNELQKGKAGEYLVCADLILNGFVAFISEQGLPYDVLLDTGKKLLKIQVKTTEGVRTVPQRRMKSKMYIFNIKRHGKNNVKRYTEHEVNLFALVCLTTRKVGYLLPKDMPVTINIRADELRGTYYDEKGIVNYEKVIRLSKTIKSMTEIAKQTELHISQISRMLKPNYKPFKTQAHYFSDFIRKPEWFLGI